MNSTEDKTPLLKSFHNFQKIPNSLQDNMLQIYLHYYHKKYLEYLIMRNLLCPPPVYSISGNLSSGVFHSRDHLFTSGFGRVPVDCRGNESGDCLCRRMGDDDDDYDDDVRRCSVNDDFTEFVVQHKVRRMFLDKGTKKLFGCRYCCYITDRKNNLKRHILAMHRKLDQILECCGFGFRSKAELKSHVSGNHKTGYSCFTCYRHFCKRALLKKHSCLI